MTVYDTELAAVSRTTQVILEIAVTSCDNNYASAVAPSTCAAADTGNGNRCLYSFPTCQDPAHFRIDTLGLKTFKFCYRDRPLPLGGEDIYPFIKSVDFAPQTIDPERAVTVNERVKIVFYDDAVTWNWNQDKASAGALTNTGTPSGTFWRRFMRIYRNYANPRNYAIVKVGFVASGMTESLYSQRGKYLITGLEIGGDGTVTMSLADKLRLTKKTESGTSQAKAPAKISATNLLNGAINGVTTTIVVDNASEITTPGTGYNVCIEMNPTLTNEFMNVTAIDTTTNTLTVERGRWGTSAVAHGDNSVFREVLQYGTESPTPSGAPLGKNPIDIVKEILSRAGIPAADRDDTTLDSERDTWLVGSVTAGVESGILFKRCGETVGAANGAIKDQVDLEDLLKQIREVCMLNLWVGEDGKVTGHVFSPARPTVTLTEVTDNESIAKDSIGVDDNEESRLTRIVVGTNLFADASGTSLSDFQDIEVYIGTDEESPGSYGDKRTRVILSPWIKVGDTSTILKLASHLFSRYRNPARRVSLDLELKDDAVKVGDFISLTTAHIQKPDGSSDGPRIMETLRKQRGRENRISYELLDTGLIRRYGFIAPAGFPNYNSATAAQKRYAFIGTATVNKVGTLAEDGYYIW